MQWLIIGSVTSKVNIKTPAKMTLKHVRAVFVLAVLTEPHTKITTSDLATLFSSNEEIKSFINVVPCFDNDIGFVFLVN